MELSTLLSRPLQQVNSGTVQSLEVRNSSTTVWFFFSDDLSSTFDDDTASTAPQAPTSLRFTFVAGLRVQYSFDFAFCGCRTRSYNVLQAVTERTCIYNDSVRLWFESYFLTRRTVLITLSVGLCNYPIQRAVSSLPPPENIYCIAGCGGELRFPVVCEDSKRYFWRYC
jgi:hypothetical protein